MNISDIISESQPPKNNPVAKHARTFNKSSVQVDRKKQAKKGYSKHKGRQMATEAPVGAVRQMGRKLGAKAASAVGMKGTAASLTGKAETGDVARQLAVDLKGYAGKTGLDPKQLDAQDLMAFLKSKGYPTTPLSGASGVLTPKQVDQALLKSAQEKAKAGGATAGSGVAGGNKQAAGGGQAGGGDSFLSKAQQKTGRAGAGSSGQGAQAGGDTASLIREKIKSLSTQQKQELLGML